MVTHLVACLSRRLAVAIVAFQLVGVGSALAQTTLPNAPTGQEQSIAPSDAQTVEFQTVPDLPQASPSPAADGSVSQQSTPACPPGQFASAFPDVTPNDWAYEAVNRLAALEIRCFPFSPQS
jgi:hypothetical protein